MQTLRATELVQHLSTTGVLNLACCARVFGSFAGRQEALPSYSFLYMHPDGRQLAEIGKLLETGRVRPVIDRIFPFEQAKEALAYLEKDRAKGKIVVRMR